MTNEVTIKEQPQIAKIAEFFETTKLVEFFTEQYGYPRELICREGLAFANKITLHDLQENNANRQFKNCSAISKQQVFLSILAWGLPTDSRDLYYLYNKNGQLTCEPSYKGLIYIAEQNGISVHAGLIFSGDTFRMKETADRDSYEIERTDPFGRKDITGCYVYIVCKGEKRVYTYSYDELEKSRQQSLKKMHDNESPAWQNFRNDMYLKCGVRKAIKIALAKIAVNSTIQALFDDEMQEAPAPAPVASQKTADFASQQEDASTIEYDMAAAEAADATFKQQQFAELQAQFDYRSEKNDL